MEDNPCVICEDLRSKRICRVANKFAKNFHWYPENFSNRLMDKVVMTLRNASTPNHACYRETQWFK